MDRHVQWPTRVETLVRRNVIGAAAGDFHPAVWRICGGDAYGV